MRARDRKVYNGNIGGILKLETKAVHPGRENAQRRYTDHSNMQKLNAAKEIMIEDK